MRHRRTPSGEIILPPQSLEGQRIDPRPDVEALIREAIERKVAEVMAERDGMFLQPFMQSRPVTEVLKRLMTVPEQRKHSWYMEDWGCRICGTREQNHAGLGMCFKCLMREKQRTASSLARREKKIERNAARLPVDVVKQAKAALAMKPHTFAGGFIDRIEQARAALQIHEEPKQLGAGSADEPQNPYAPGTAGGLAKRRGPYSTKPKPRLPEATE